MRIGIVTQSYYPIPSGLTEHVYYLAKELINLGHEPTIITSRFFHNNNDLGLDVVRVGWDFRLPIPINGSFNNVNICYQLTKKLRRICEEKRFDIIHIHCPLDPIFPLAALRNLSIPKVGTFHSYAKVNLGYEIFGHQFREYADQLDCRIAVSEAAKEFSERYFSGEYDVIPNGINLERFNPNIRPIEKFNDGLFNILFVGRLDPRKGVKYLLKAFPLIYEQYPHCRLIVVGNGFLTDYYRMYTPEDSSHKIFFEGYVLPKDIPRYYATADVFCAPAIGGESFGIVLLEAMASGKPIVASNITGYSQLITDYQEGLLVPPKNPSAIAEAVIELIQNRELRKEMGRRGLEKARKFSWHAVAKQIEQCYYKALANCH